MTTYFKAVRPNLTDFRTGTVVYEVGTVVTHPAKRKVRDDPSTHLSVSTVETDCIGFRWPARLLRVEGIGKPMRSSQHPNKRAFSAIKVIEELESWRLFGPQGQDVVRVIERAKTLTTDECREMGAQDAAQDAAQAAWEAAWVEAWVAAWEAAWEAREAAWEAAWKAAREAARGAAWEAANAYLVRDLITPEQFGILAGPWLSVVGEK